LQIEEIISDDSPVKSPVIERRSSQLLSQMRKPLFQPRQSTLTQLATPKPVQPAASFDFDFGITEVDDGDSNDIWDDPKTFKPKVSDSMSKPPVASRKFQPKTSRSECKSSNFTRKDIASKSNSSKLKTSSNGTRTDPVESLSQSPTNVFAFDTNLLLPDENFDVPKRTPVKTIVLLSQSPKSASGNNKLRSSIHLYQSA
jgi:hypothetical protein